MLHTLDKNSTENCFITLNADYTKSNFPFVNE